MIIKLFFIFIVLAILVSGYFLFFRKKEDKHLLDKHEELLREGKPNAKKFKLRDLYLSVNDIKRIKVGKIESYNEVIVEENIKDKKIKRYYSIFGVKDKKKPLYFYQVNKKLHSKLLGDVTVKKWNFKLNGIFYGLNTDELIKNPEITDPKRNGTDALSNLNPIVHNAIQLNPYHRIAMREKNLIKEPTEMKNIPDNIGESSAKE